MNNGELIGYDLDGVIVKEYHMLNKLYHLPRAVPALIHFRDRFFPQLYKPLPGCHIVTGRPHWEQASTERWLRKREVPYVRLHMALDCPYSNRHIYGTLEAKFKARVIKEFGLKYFVESSDHQLHILWQLGCPALDCIGALSMGLLSRV